MAGSGDVTGDGRVATDPDADGRYEDVDGNGTADILDVAILLSQFDDLSTEDEPFFDFNADGTVDIIDVATLLGDELIG